MSVNEADLIESESCGPAVSRILILSESYINNSTAVDATRWSFVREARRLGPVMYLQANDFDFENAAEVQGLLKQIRKFGPDFVLSVNAAGLHQAVLDELRSRSVPIVTWYWDHPDLFAARMIELSLQTQVFHAAVGFEASRVLQGRGSWLPFSGLEVDPKTIAATQRRPSHDIVHLGTMWTFARLLQMASAGLFRGSNNEFLWGADLLAAIRDSSKAEDFWLTQKGIRISHGQLINALAGAKRAQILGWFLDYDIHVCGGTDWQFYSWPSVPDLITKYKFANVVTQDQMKQLLDQYRINLNVFHPQNPDGGPNFRVLDSAAHGIALLSDFNKHCEKLFPHGEAAWYFKNPRDAREGVDRLLQEPDFYRKLTFRAAEILSDEHTHSKRWLKFADDFGLSIQPSSELVAVCARRLPRDIFEVGPKSSAPLPPDPLQTPMMAMETRFANLEVTQIIHAAFAPKQIYLYIRNLIGRVCKLHPVAWRIAKAIQLKFGL